MANGQPQQGQQQPTTQEIEASFRQEIDDIVAVIEGLAPLYSDIHEMIDSLKLAKDNDGQLRLIMKQVSRIRLHR